MEQIELAMSRIGKLMCDLESDTKPEGHTLSYTWGNPGTTECEFESSLAEIIGHDLSALHVDELAELTTRPVNTACH